MGWFTKSKKNKQKQEANLSQNESKDQITSLNLSASKTSNSINNNADLNTSIVKNFNKSKRRTPSEKDLARIRYCYYLCLKRNLGFFSNLGRTYQESFIDACVKDCSNPKILKNWHKHGQTGDDQNQNTKTTKIKTLNVPGSDYIKKNGLIFLFQGQLAATMTDLNGHYTQKTRLFNSYTIIGLQTAVLDLPSVETIKPNFTERVDSCQKVIYATVSLEKILIFLKNLPEQEKIECLVQNCYLAGIMIKSQQRKVLGYIYRFFDMPEIFKGIRNINF